MPAPSGFRCLPAASGVVGPHQSVFSHLTPKGRPAHSQLSGRHISRPPSLRERGDNGRALVQGGRGTPIPLLRFTSLPARVPHMGRKMLDLDAPLACVDMRALQNRQELSDVAGPGVSLQETHS